MITIRDIAKCAEVSVSTASLALNGDSRVKPSTRQRIIDIAAALNYHPSRAAKSLSKGRTYNLHLLNPLVDGGLSSSFFTRFVKGIHEIVYQHNYSLVLSVLNDELEAQHNLERLILERWTDGVILMNLSQENRLLDMLSERLFPHVLLGNSSVKGIQSVDSDNRAIAYEATCHLLEHKGRVLFLNGPEQLTFVQERSQGYRQAHFKQGYEPDEHLLQFELTTAVEARARVTTLIKQGLQFRSILASSDALAVGAMRALRDYDLAIPKDVAVLGINNDDISEYTEPRLSSVELNATDLGREAAKLLVASIDGVTAIRRLVPHRLVIRESSHLTGC